MLASSCEVIACPGGETGDWRDLLSPGFYKAWLHPVQGAHADHGSLLP